jgi:hypothetical protein
MNKIRSVNIFWVAALLGSLATGAAAPEPGSIEEKAMEFSWAIEADPALPNVLILGDSISIGYTLQVRQFLKDKANVYRPLDGTMPENCGDSRKAVNSIDRWLAAAPKWDVIHFNSGLHDLKRVSGKDSGPDLPPVNSIAAYQDNLQMVVDKMKATGAKLIFATTTDYPAGVTPCRLPEDAALYNAAALKVMKRNNIAVNDLYAFTKGRLGELQMPVNVHFSENGSMKIGQRVAERIASEMAWGKIAMPDYPTFTEARAAGDRFYQAKDYAKAVDAYEDALCLAMRKPQMEQVLAKLEKCRAMMPEINLTTEK